MSMIQGTTPTNRFNLPFDVSEVVALRIAYSQKGAVIFTKTEADCTLEGNTVTLTAAGWTGSGPYTQSISVEGATATSRVDMQPDETVLAQMLDDGVNALFIKNDNGALTAVAMGAAPTADLTVQVTITEVK